MAADPEDDADGAEHQHDDRRHQQRALPDAVHGGAERVFDAAGEVAPVAIFVAVGLHGADLVQRFVEERADVADAVLRRARQLAHAAAEQDDRHDDDRHAGEHEQRELEARQREHHEAADHQQRVADRHRRCSSR